jgi:hypothetical protein
MFLHLIAVRMMQMAVVKVIDVTVVPNALVAAFRTMLVSVALMVSRHVIDLLPRSHALLPIQLGVSQRIRSDRQRVKVPQYC